MSFLQQGIRDFIDRKAPTIKTSASITDLQKAFADPHDAQMGSVYAVDDNGLLSGKITLGAVNTLNTPGAKRPATAGEMASKDGLVAVNVDAELWQLLRIMNGENSTNKKLDQIPIVDSSKKFIGVVERDQLSSALSTIQFPVSASGQLEL